jgi:O-antigen/teichoic acid export membrane protein
MANLIFKNSVILYIRMFVTMIIALLSSRLILEYLGAEDYGIYNIVGGVVGMMGLLNTVLISTSNRYISIEIGKGDKGNVNNVFSASLIIHILLIILTVLLAETFGLYYMNNFLNVPPEKLNDALFIFHFSLISISFSVFSVPYLALMTAYEDFGFQAKVNILQSFLTLGVSFLISIDGFNRLRFYSVMLCLIFIIISIVNVLHVKYKYKHIEPFITKDKTLFKSMGAFSSWMAIGTISYVARNQGSSLILNSFFGAVINAAFAISLMVNAQINQFSQNVNSAFIPQITKCYGSGEIEKSKSLSMQSCKYSFFMTFVIAFPVFLELDYIFMHWLKNPPEYTVLFCKLMIIESLLINLNLGIGTFVFASGKVKFYQIFTNTISILNLPISYFLFKAGFPPTAIIFGSISTVFLMMVFRHILISRLFKFELNEFIKNVYSPVLLVVLPLLLFLTIPINIDDSFVNVFIIISSAFILSIISVWIFGLNKKEKHNLVKLINKRFC